MSKRIVNATTWTLSGQFAKLFIRLIVNIVLARLLTPNEFGLLGMVTIVITLLNSLSELGLFSSLIQKQNVTQEDLSSVFWTSVMLGLLTGTALYLSAPIIVWYYKEEALLNVVRVLSVNFLLNALSVTHGAVLTKKLSFKKIEICSTVAVICSSTTGLLLGYFNYGIWALVLQQNIYSAVNTFLIFMVEKWRPSFVISMRSLKGLLNFGLKVFASAVLNTFVSSLDVLILGRYFSAATLGLYNFAQNLVHLPVSTFAGSLSRVLFPVMAEVQHDNGRLKITYRRAINLVNVIIVPAMGTVFILAPGIVSTLLSDKWINMVTYIRFFALLALLYPISILNINILLAKGHGDKFLRLEVIKKSLFIAGLSMVIFFGIGGMLWGIAITSLAGAFFNLYISGKVSMYSVKEQFKDLRPVILLSAGYIFALAVLNAMFAAWVPVLFAMILSFVLSITFFIFLTTRFQPAIILEFKTILHGLNASNKTT